MYIKKLDIKLTTVPKTIAIIIVMIRPHSDVKLAKTKKLEMMLKQNEIAVKNSSSSSGFMFVLLNRER